uniref:WAP domain-containing protein n=1 Tax=Heterorhabditis bacteriophora TaxID=37862 RepID=A0A1I7XFS6_HETBA
MSNSVEKVSISRLFDKQCNSSFELCDYWLAFGIRRQECIADDSDPTTTEVPIPICNYKFLLATCTRYDMCESKKVVSPINWCSSDNECAGKKCCSTGCGYNICV